MEISVKHHFLKTQITALKVKEHITFIGEGQYLHIYNIITGKKITSIQVFSAPVVHGIRIQEYSTGYRTSIQEDTPGYRTSKQEDTPGYRTSLHEDATGYKIQESSVKQALWIVAVFGQKSLAVLCFNPSNYKCHVLLEEIWLSDWIIDVAWEDDISHIVLALAHNSLLRYQFTISKFNQTKNTPNLNSELKKFKEIIIRNSQSIGDSIAEKAECTEKSLLYSGCIALRGSWDRAVLLGGTVYQEILIWGPGGSVDEYGRFLPYHRLKGHQGSIFSVNYCPRRKLISTTSDDRSLRVWDVIQPKKRAESSENTASNSTDNINVEEHNWKHSKIAEKMKCYGHDARVWQSCILSDCIVSVGEDSKICIWSDEGELVKSWKGHDGASIWSVTGNETMGRLVTGAGDGSVRSWCLNGKEMPIVQLPNLPSDRSSVTNNESNVTKHESSNVTYSESRNNIANNESSVTNNEPIDNITKNESRNSVTNDERNFVKNNELRSIATNDESASALYCMSFSDNKPNFEKHDSKTTDYSFNDETDLFSEGQGEVSKYKKAQDIPKQDFPRCVGLIGDRQPLVIMDSGRLYFWLNSSWSLEYENERLKNYALLKINKDLRTAALGTLYGDVILLNLENGRLKVILNIKVCEGKIYSLLWLSENEILVCSGSGAMTVWQLYKEPDQWKMCLEQSHVLMASKQRWVTTACVYPQNTTRYLICGDRSGSIHLYHPKVIEATQSLRYIHGKNGVTSILVVGERVYSSGRDGCVRCLLINNDNIQIITTSRVTGASWVAQLIFTLGRILAICFHDVKVKVWSVEEERSLVEGKCGGGHRSWDLNVLEAEQELVIIFLKVAKVYTFTAPLKDKLLPLIKAPVNTQETMCLQVLFSSEKNCENNILCVTGGEDTTLRLHKLCCENYKPLGVIRSHISNIRAMCVIDANSVTNRTEDKGSVWLVSAGGRAQIKVWKCDYQSSHSDINLSNQHSDINALSSQHRSDMKGNTPIHKNQQNTGSINNQNSTESNCISISKSDVICRETTSHMLRTGSHKTWKSQELTLDPETRYMDAIAFWISASQAVVCLASSDGYLRIFSFCAKSENLELVCTQEWRCCILKVAKLVVSSKTILVSTTTEGSVIFWDPQDVINWMAHEETEGSVTPKLKLLASFNAHQSGINSIAFNPFFNNKTGIDVEASVTQLTLITGGDDNKLGVWKVLIDEETLKISFNSICEVYGHASQITGLQWLSHNLFASVSIDQRLMFWKLQYPYGESKSTKLKIMESYFTGVPDIKGLAVVNFEQDTQKIALCTGALKSENSQPYQMNDSIYMGNQDRKNAQSSGNAGKIHLSNSPVHTEAPFKVLSTLPQYNNSERSVNVKEILVYGMGLQSFQVTFGTG